MARNTNGILALLIIGVLAFWGFFMGGFDLLFGGFGGGGNVALRVQTNDAIGEAVFSPSGASVKVWDKATGEFLGALTEDSSNDGKWDSAYNVPVGSIVIVKVVDSGSTFYTRQVERVVPPGASGVDRIGVDTPANASRSFCIASRRAAWVALIFSRSWLLSGGSKANM